MWPDPDVLLWSHGILRLTRSDTMDRPACHDALDTSLSSTQEVSFDGSDDM